MDIRNVATIGVAHLSVRIVAFLLMLTQVRTSVAESDVDVDSSVERRAEFNIGKNGRLLILPIELADRELLCLLDTGAATSGFDVSVKELLGRSRGRQTIRTPAGRQVVESFAWPSATLGGESLSAKGTVVCVDLEEVRRATGQNVRGVVGMDVLRSRRVHVNFDQGILAFLPSLPDVRSLGTKLPINVKDDGMPWINASFDAHKSEQFLIDTGAQGNSLKAELFAECVEDGHILLGTSSTSVTLAGAVQGEAGRLLSLSVGPYNHQGLRVASSDLSSVGLRHLSRFLVTFDFPGNAIYLKRGANYLKPEPRATSGMTLVWIEKEVVVTAVKKGGPAEAAQLRRDDVIVQVNGKKAGEYDHFSLRELLTSEVGRIIPVTIRRDSQEFELKIALDER